MSEYQKSIWEKELRFYNSLLDMIQRTKLNNHLVYDFVESVKSAMWDTIIWTVSCMDDRLSLHHLARMIRIAGSFVLLWVKKITTHNDCGTAKKHIGNNNLQGNADERKEVEAFCMKYWFEHEYIWDIENPHEARSAFLDTTAKFNSNLVSLNSFVITAHELIPTIHILDELNIAIDIATWPHWFRDKINSENPFFVFVLWEKGVYKEIEEIEKKIRIEFYRLNIYRFKFFLFLTN